MAWKSDEEDVGELVEGCYINAVTAKAVKITALDGTETVWVPKSMILDPDPDELRKWEQDVDITVRTWFARKEGLV